MALFHISVDGSSSLPTENIWPDGDAPEDPTDEHVAALIGREYHSVGEWLREWNLEDGVRVHVGAVEVQFR